MEGSTPGMASPLTPTRILLVSNHAEIVGGGEISFLALLEGLDRSRWAPVAVVPSEGEIARHCRDLGVTAEVIPFPSLRRPGPAIFRSVAQMRRLIRTAGVRLLHANGSRAMLYAGPAGRLGARPTIWHVRVADRDPLLDRSLACLARAIIVNSNAVGRRFAWAPPGKIRCIYNGVDLQRFSPRQPPPGLRRSLNLPEDVPVIVSVGRFVRYKGYDSLLEAARLVHAARPEVHWALVGDGELRGSLEAQSQAYRLETCVHFLGWRQDVPDILAQADLFVLPSLGEHFGRVLIEAMAMGKAVVATDAGGVPEIVIHGETGLLVPPGDPRAFAGATLNLLEDPRRAALLGIAGRRRAESTFGLPAHVEAVERLYAELLEDAHGNL